MASIAIFLSTAAALLFSAVLLAFGSPSATALFLGYLVVAKATFWAVILRISLQSDTAEQQNQV